MTNPGRAQDEFLSERVAWPVGGAQRAFNDAWNDVALIMGSVTREYFPSGNTGEVNVNERQGLLLIEDQNNQWEEAQNARWVAEDALRRLEEAMEPEEFTSSPLAAEAYLWAGFSNRMLGENFCQAVFDGGEAQPHTAYFERAESQFTQAMEIAAAAGEDSMALVARAGRASVRINLNQWDEAVADAEAVTSPDFAFRTPFFDLTEDQYNWLYWSSAGTPYRVHTAWNTFYEDYYADTGDPRTPWVTVPGAPEGTFGVGPFGTVPWLPQRKHDATSTPVDLVDYAEMRLIVAEAALMDGDYERAMDIINGIREDVPGVDLPPWSADSPEDAWSALFRERGIVLWLEGRRAGDRRRWVANKAPGRLDVHEVPSTTAPVHERGAGTYLSPDMDLCIPIPLSERETNPNIPTT